jgi:hypothetical protein
MVAFLRGNLFTYRNLSEWFDRPFDVLPILPGPVQHLFSLPGLGNLIFFDLIFVKAYFDDLVNSRHPVEKRGPENS